MTKLLIPILILSVMFGVAWYLVELRPEPKGREIEREIPFVEAVLAKEQTLRSSVRTHGIVRPRTRTTLIAEVSGIIEKVAPFREEENSSNHQNTVLASFRAGGFFRKGDLLLKIEDVDLQAAIAEAKANLTRANLQLLQEQEFAKQAKIEWGERDWKKAPALVKRIPQILKAEAENDAAEARLAQASKNLSRSSVRAPFEGRILQTMADVGQQVGPVSSSALAEIYALDAAEIDLALSQAEMSFLGFDDGFLGKANFKVQADVLDEGENILHTGSLDRSEGIVDKRTRLTNLVVQINNCFANPFSDLSPSDPLAIGQFVNLLLRGQTVRAFVIPESAFRTENQILVVDENQRLLARKVSVLHRIGNEVWVHDGIAEGDRVCITPMDVFAVGMQVRIPHEDTDANRTAK
ncbi:MAG: hypothetical protein CMI29_07665 [Opitutae bacterium]|nr:hypothetical protein [Opitutae bacterium]|tara:strand:+ start:2653 stop:3879 length:1227 start_codon:yes stop_codon:yes gene_type:complete